jgi:predicted Zn-dependent protease
MTLSCLKKGDWVYAFQALSSPDGFPKYASSFKATVASFRNLTEAAKIDRKPKRLTLVKANGTDTLQAILKRSGVSEKDGPVFAVINGLELTAVPAAGKLIKTAR